MPCGSAACAASSKCLSSETANSAFHGTRLDVNHISDVMERLVNGAERRFGLNRYSMAPQTVFISHETFTPARGGSAAAEVTALRNTFGDAANEIIVCNTKGFTGHPMGAGVEDVIAVKILEYGIVPPVPNYKEVDPELGMLNLSRGGRYPVQYALHLAAGFGSQISMTLIRRIPGGHGPLRQQDRLSTLAGRRQRLDNTEPRWSSACCASWRRAPRTNPDRQRLAIWHRPGCSRAAPLEPGQRSCNQRR